MSKNWLNFFDRIPPAVCRAMAIWLMERNGEKTTGENLAKKSGIPLRSFRRLSYTSSFKNTRLSTVSKFIEASGVDYTDEQQMAEFARDCVANGFPNLKDSQYKRLIRVMAKEK